MARARLAPPAASRASPPSVARASGKRMTSEDRMLVVFVAWARERWPAEYARNSRPIRSLAVQGFPSFPGGFRILDRRLAGLERDCESRSALASGIVKRLKRRRRRLLHLNAALPMRRGSRPAEGDGFVRGTNEGAHTPAFQSRWMRLHA